MPTLQENLQTQLDSLSAQYAALGGQRSDYSIDGQSVSNAQQGMNILAEMKRIQDMLAELEGPFEFEIQGG